MREGERPCGYRACRNGGVVPPNWVPICSGANCEWGLLSSIRIWRRVPLIARLDWRGGLLLDSASVATPELGPTRMASPNRNLGTLGLFLFIYILFRFFFQKCCDPNPRLDPNGGSEPELGLL